VEKPWSESARSATLGREARSADIPAKTFAQKKIAPSAAWSDPEIADKTNTQRKLCTTNPPAKRIQSEQARKL